MDVDGTLTDGKIYMGRDGEVCKAFDVKDGCGIHDILIPSGIRPIIITSRSSEIVKQRCDEIGICEVYQGVKNKTEKLEKILEHSSFTYKDVAYIGDDIGDISCMQSVKAAGGVVGCPADAVCQVKDLADFICSRSGGNGAVREFIEWLLD